MPDNSRVLVAETGRTLLSMGLVARTWGNISARVDEHSFAISPSGLSYESMTEEDVPIYDFAADTWEGSRKPSSEKKIHAAAYELYPEVNFVIHTHQDYATAVGLAGADRLKLTEEEKSLLGNIEVAGYGLPGTGKLKKNVEAALKKGSKVVLMVHHGAVILGDDQEDAINKAKVLEEACKRTVMEAIGAGNAGENQKYTPEKLSDTLLKACSDLVVVSDDNIIHASKTPGIRAELDDIAQMIGPKLRCVANDDAQILKALSLQDAVLVRNVGCVILTEDPDDAKALEMLVKKAAMTRRYTRAVGVKNELTTFDCRLMNIVFKKKYARKKAG